MSTEAIYQAVLTGNAPEATSQVTAALEAGTPANEILNDGCIAAMSEVGRLFEAGELYASSLSQLTSFQVVKLTIPEVIILKAQEFTRPPLLYVPVGLAAALAVGVGYKNGFIQNLISRKGKGN